MNIFSPYRVEEDSINKLHLIEPVFRRRLLFVVMRIIPLLLIAGGALIISNEYNNMTRLHLVAFIIAVGALSFLLFSRRITFELEIDTIGFTINYQRYFSKQLINIPFADTDYLKLRVRHGKVPGYYYSIVTKIGQHFPLFKIPKIYMTKEKQQQVNEKLIELTGLTLRKS